jgi:hypothetical protein
MVVFDNSSGFTGKVSGFALGDQMDLADIGFGSSTTLSYNGKSTGGTLTVSDGVHIAKIAMVGSYTQSNFTLADDGSGHTMVSDPSVSVVGVLDLHHHL